MDAEHADTDGPRPRGRPRLDIDDDAVADAVADLLAEGGYDAVSIADTAERLAVSRSTLYRKVPTKAHLLGMLFERSTRELSDAVSTVVEQHQDRPGEQLRALVRLQIHAAVRMRRYLPVFFGGAELPAEVVERWYVWSREFESRWTDVVRGAMDAGVLDRADPVVATRLLLGMCIWVSRWYRPQATQDADDIADVALTLLSTGPLPAEAPPSPLEPPRDRARPGVSRSAAGRARARPRS